MKETIAFRQSKRLEAVARSYFSGPEKTTPRNITQEMLQTIAGHEAVSPRQLALDQRYQPLYSQLGLRIQGQNLRGFDEDGVHIPGGLELGRESARFQRAGDISDVRTLGPEAYAAFLNANPLLKRSLGELTGRTTDSDLLRKLNLQANSELDAGGRLTPTAARTADQEAAAIFADRGMLNTDQGAAAALLNREVYRNARSDRARGFAGSVQGMNQQQNDFTGRVAQIAGSQFDPFLALLTRPSSGQGGGGSGGGQQIGTGASRFDPMNAYAQDIYSSNQNAEATYNAGQAQAQNANTQAAISAASLIAMIALSDKRLKKNVKTVGKTADEIPIVEFEYKTDPKKKPTRHRGVMAQDVEKVRPENVITDPRSGIKFVDYWGLGMQPLEVAA